MDSEPQIVATGDKWIGYGVKTTSSAIHEIIDNSKKSLLLTIYIISEDNILNKIRIALNRGVKVEIFIHDDKDFYKSIMDKLLELQKKYNYIEIFSGSDEFMHAKVLISDKKDVLIGSANLTKSGLSNNYELGILLEDRKIAYELEMIIKRLVQ